MRNILRIRKHTCHVQFNKSNFKKKKLFNSIVVQAIDNSEPTRFGRTDIFFKFLAKSVVRIENIVKP